MRGLEPLGDGVPELRRDCIGGVQAPAVHSGRPPALEHPHHVVDHGRLSWLGFTNASWPSERLGDGCTRRPPGQPVRTNRRPPESGPDCSACLEFWEVPADVVEDAVQDDPQASVVGLVGDDLGQVVGVAQPRIDAEMVDGVVAVALLANTGPSTQPWRPMSAA